MISIPLTMAAFRCCFRNPVSPVRNPQRRRPRASRRPESKTCATAPEPCPPHCAGADLRGADLNGADLTAADPRGAILTGADLRNATLYRATLAGAVLIAVDLTGSDLTHADLTGRLPGCTPPSVSPPPSAVRLPGGTLTPQ